MKHLRIILVSLLISYCPGLHAATGQRTAIVDAVQTESSTRVGYENLMYVQQAGAWNGSPNCSATWAYFNVMENPYLAAVALAARTRGMPLQVLVDDSLPKINGICQVINMQL